MELLQLRYFCMVAKMESITNAAAELNISQPSLSKTIINLEKELGATLFDRVGRHIRLNSRGGAFLEKATASLVLMDGAVREISESSGKLTGEVRLRVLAGSSLMPGFAVSFAKAFPDVRLRLFPRELHALRRMEDTDFVIGASPMDYGQRQVVSLFEEDMVLAVGQGHPLAARESVDLSEAKDLGFVCASKGPTLHAFAESLCCAAGFVPRVAMEADSMSTMRAMVREELAIALLPQSALRDRNSDGIVAISIHTPTARRTVSLSWPDNNCFSALHGAFVDFCRDYFA